jgi:hypothetical protein
MPEHPRESPVLNASERMRQCKQSRQTIPLLPATHFVVPLETVAVVR